MVRIERGITDEHLEEVYSHPSMQKLSHDHFESEPIEHPLVSYYSAFDNDEFMGCYMVISLSPIESEAHMLLFPKSRRCYRELTKVMAHILFEEVDRISTVIIGERNTTKNHITKAGFKLEGIRRGAFVVKGIKKDAYLYALLKSEFKG